jgi:universal stress protein A
MVIMKNVLVATDFSPVADSALAYGRALARTFGATLHVLHVVQDVAGRLTYADASITGLSSPELQADLERVARTRLRALVAGPERRDGRVVEALRVGRSVSTEIVQYARDMAVDVVVLGATGRGAINRLLVGSVANNVIRHAPCPVITVRCSRPAVAASERLQATA